MAGLEPARPNLRGSVLAPLCIHVQEAPAHAGSVVSPTSGYWIHKPGFTLERPAGIEPAPYGLEDRYAAVTPRTLCLVADPGNAPGSHRVMSPYGSLDHDR